MRQRVGVWESAGSGVNWPVHGGVDRSIISSTPAQPNKLLSSVTRSTKLTTSKSQALEPPSFPTTNTFALHSASFSHLGPLPKALLYLSAYLNKTKLSTFLLLSPSCRINMQPFPHEFRRNLHSVSMRQATSQSKARRFLDEIPRRKTNSLPGPLKMLGRSLTISNGARTSLETQRPSALES